jgi:hypothetical protein
MAERAPTLPGLSEALEASAKDRDLVTELRARATALEKYAQHGNCSVWGEHGYDEAACDCGLNALLGRPHQAPALARCTCATCTADGPTGLLPLGGAA